MKFADIVALAKNGYTVADIKELMSLDAEGKEEETQEELEEDEEPEKVEPETDEAEDDIDYRSEYETLKKELDALKKEVTHKDTGKGHQKTDEDIMNEVALSFM